jgi:gluconate kinase
MSGENPTMTPWKNGFYRMKGMPFLIFTVDGENVTMESVSGKATNHGSDPNMKGTWKHGDFGEAQADIAKEAGKHEYNIDINLWGGMLGGKGIVSDDRMKVTFWGIGNAVDNFTWENKESILAFRGTGDPVDAPPSHYQVQPDYQGQFLFISGAPGLGKSTTGQLLSKKAGYVYYEGDCFWTNVNPYIPPDAKEPSVAGMTQNFLTGVPQDRIDVCAEADAEFDAMIQGKDSDQTKLLATYSMMAKDIAKERKRLGGDWAVAQALPTRALRDHMRKELGQDLIFVVLHMSKQHQEERIKARHGEEAGGLNYYLLEAYKIYEPAAEDEPNALNVMVSPGMTPDDVVDKILTMLKKH